MTSFRDVVHLPLFDSLEEDQLNEQLPENITQLPYFQEILKASKQENHHTNITHSWIELNQALKTCSYLGIDRLACTFIKQALWKRDKQQIEQILDVEASKWKTLKNMPFLTAYLQQRGMKILAVEQQQTDTYHA
jgi:undecaprenyl pyrophosphate synthase